MFNIIKMTVPPQVINLDVYEIDNRQQHVIAYLRWQSPIPPLNGTLRGYSIRLCSFTYECRDTEISLQDICNLWDDYICGTAYLNINTEKIEVRKWHDLYFSVLLLLSFL